MKNKRREFLKKSFLGAAGITFGGIGLRAESYTRVNGFKDAVDISGTDTGQVSGTKTVLPRPVVPMTEERLGRKSLNLYGSLEEPIQKMRSFRPLDLNSDEWKKANPGKSYQEWAQHARECLLSGLHYELPEADLKARTIDRMETDSFIREKIEFNTTPWFRVPGYFYTPKNVPLPAPGLIVMHEWGGPMLFGAERVCGEPVHPVIVSHRAECTSGRPLADWYASHGFAVVVIDAYHFGHRTPRDIGGLPAIFNPATLDSDKLQEYDRLTRELLYLGVRELNWAGTTWAGCELR